MAFEKVLENTIESHTLREARITKRSLARTWNAHEAVLRSFNATVVNMVVGVASLLQNHIVVYFS